VHLEAGRLEDDVPPFVGPDADRVLVELLEHVGHGEGGGRSRPAQQLPAVERDADDTLEDTKDFVSHLSRDFGEDHPERPTGFYLMKRILEDLQRNYLQTSKELRDEAALQQRSREFFDDFYLGSKQEDGTRQDNGASTSITRYLTLMNELDASTTATQTNRIRGQLLEEQQKILRHYNTIRRQRDREEVDE